MLDERLGLAASLYPVCRLGADIGTDHGYLPCHLLKSNTCREMILCDISEKALSHAKSSIAHAHLEDHCRLVCSDGLSAIDRPCDCISITGMGGDTMSDILRAGQEKLQGAVLVLSAHTNLPTLRQTIQDIGYHFTAEIPCKAAGRYYLVWRAEPGYRLMTPEELQYGTDLLLRGGHPLLKEYLSRRLWVEQRRLDGLHAAADPDLLQISEAERTIKHWEELLHDCA